MSIYINRFTFPFIIDENWFLDTTEQGPLHYNLLGVIAHKGNAKVGHYISFNNIEEQWYKMNDSKVTKFTQEEAIDQTLV